MEEEQPQPIRETVPEEPAEGEASVEPEAGRQDEEQAEDDPPSDR